MSEPLHNILQQFISRFQNEKDARGAVVNVINKISHTAFTPEDIIFQSRTIFIKGNTREKSEVFLHKDTILEIIQKSVQKKFFNDIR